MRAALAEPIRTAGNECYTAEEKVRGRLQNAHNGARVTPEVVDTMAVALLVQIGQMNEDAIRLLLDKESDQAAFAALVTALGQEGLAGGLTTELR